VIAQRCPPLSRSIFFQKGLNGLRWTTGCPVTDPDAGCGEDMLLWLVLNTRRRACQDLGRGWRSASQALGLLATSIQCRRDPHCNTRAKPPALSPCLARSHSPGYGVSEAAWACMLQSSRASSWSVATAYAELLVVMRLPSPPTCILEHLEWAATLLRNFPPTFHNRLTGQRPASFDLIGKHCSNSDLIPARCFSTLWLEYEMSNVVFRDINLTMCDIPPRPALPRLAPTTKMDVFPVPEAHGRPPDRIIHHRLNPSRRSPVTSRRSRPPSAS
jgi:hypothetical protein